MKYKIFPNQEAADKINQARAEAMGCNLNEEDATSSWWHIIKNPLDDTVAMSVPEEDEIFFTGLVTEEEASELGFLSITSPQASPFGRRIENN